MVAIGGMAAVSSSDDTLAFRMASDVAERMEDVMAGQECTVTWSYGAPHGQGFVSVTGEDWGVRLELDVRSGVWVVNYSDAWRCVNSHAGGDIRPSLIHANTKAMVGAMAAFLEHVRTVDV